MINSRSYIPQQRDLVWLTFEPHAGHEQGGRRPALILSPGRYNQRTGLALICPITSRIKGYPFEVIIPDGLPVSGAVLSDQIRSLDWRARKAELICVLPADVVSGVAQKLGTLMPV